MSNVEPVGMMKIAPMVYMTLMCELLEEQYGDEFIKMTQTVQDEIIMLVGNDMDFAVQCVMKKFNEPQFSMKQALMDRWQKAKMDA